MAEQIVTSSLISSPVSSHQQVVPLRPLRSPFHDTLDQLIIGTSPATVALKEMVGVAASCHSTVKITGESGTGKELVANTIHKLSDRSQHPFVAINCAAFAETLLESELFGYEKGSFTGAQTRKEGLLLSAGRGTIFLDEFGEMSLPMQAKILRVLQERMVRPVGSKTEYPLDARIIIATNKDLEREVKEGRFREDLYYRINVLPVHLPPLRERKADLPLLIEHILTGKVMRHTNLASPPALAPAATLLLCEYHWPGNIRELENVLERLVLLGADQQVIQLFNVERVFRSLRVFFHLDETSQSSIARCSDRAKLERMEMALALANGNKTKAAQMLGMNRPAFTRLHRRVLDRTASPS